MLLPLLLCTLASALLQGPAAADPSADHVDLVTFGGEAGSTFAWAEDDSGGGAAACDFAVDSEYHFALFNGSTTAATAAGGAGSSSFCRAATTAGLLHPNTFRAALGYTHLSLFYRSTMAYGGFRLALGPKGGALKKHLPFTAAFNATGDGVWRVAAVPFAAFSQDGSSCSAAAPPGACLTEKQLQSIGQIGLQAEGAAGAFSLQVKWIRAGYGDTCGASSYCCPDAMRCLTPSKTTCKGDQAGACTGGAVCCPLTELCVAAGRSCTSACQAPWAEKALFCCPDAKACLAPTDPGVLCAADSDCQQGHSTPVTCCPLTNLCVTAADACQPGDAAAPSWWPAK